MSDLNKKVQNAIKVIQMASMAALERERERESISELHPLTIAYSTGKDSDVVLHLAKMSGVEFSSVYHATGLDPKGSLEHARENNVTIVKPDTPFFKLMEKNGFPTRRARWCCRLLKEKYDSPVSLQGIRASESTARASMYKEPTVCRIYSKSERTEVFLPILDWSDKDVEDFIKSEGIKCHRHYYDENGNFHVERRVGCLCCVLQSTNKLKEEFKKHPHMVKSYIFFGKRWWDSHPNSNSRNKFRDVYDLFFHNVFCKDYNDYIYKTTGMFGRTDTKAFLEDYFKIDLP